MGLEWIVIWTSANYNILLKMEHVRRQVFFRTWCAEGGGVASFVHALILIWRWLYSFRSLRRKISVKPAVKCQAQSVISNWVPCYNHSSCSVWDTSVACNTSHITHFGRRYSHCLSSYNHENKVGFNITT